MKIPILAFALLGAFTSSLLASDAMPVFQHGDKILFQGDSITDGGRQQTDDYNHNIGQSYAYIIAATIGNQLADRNLSFINRGISGNTVVQLAGRWQADTLDLKPNLLSILVGINDANGSESIDQYEQTYEKLITDTQAALPGIRIVLCEPFLLPVGSHKDHYDDEKTRLKNYQNVVAKLASKYNLPYVEFQKAFDDACLKAPPEHWSWDGIHPSYAGHGLMVQTWLDTVNKFYWHE
jgi:lysophospholipase L1-like esterase